MLAKDATTRLVCALLNSILRIYDLVLLAQVVAKTTNFRFAYLINKSNSFARPAKWTDHFSSFTKNVKTQVRFGIFFPNFDTTPLNSVSG